MNGLGGGEKILKKGLAFWPGLWDYISRFRDTDGNAPLTNGNTRSLRIEYRSMRPGWVLDPEGMRQ